MDKSCSLWTTLDNMVFISLVTLNIISSVLTECGNGNGNGKAGPHILPPSGIVAATMEMPSGLGIYLSANLTNDNDVHRPRTPTASFAPPHHTIDPQIPNHSNLPPLPPPPALPQQMTPLSMVWTLPFHQKGRLFTKVHANKLQDSHTIKYNESTGVSVWNAMVSGFVLRLPPRDGFWNEFKWTWNMIRSMPCKNLCRVYVHLAFTYFVGPCEVNLTGSTFSTHECVWSVMVMGVQSCVWNRP